MWDIVMKQCRIVLCKASAVKQTRKFSKLLGKKLIVRGTIVEGLVGSQALVSCFL
ncbi:hypothetical protein ACP275_03G030100 [Erythranthe tilingii]